jgi:hypothetical protein
METSSVQVTVCVGRFSVDLMTQQTIWSPANVNVKKWEVAIPLHQHCELYIPVKAIQMVKTSLFPVARQQK